MLLPEDRVFLEYFFNKFFVAVAWFRAYCSSI